MTVQVNDDEVAYQEYQAQQERARRNGREEKDRPKIKRMPVITFGELDVRDLPPRQFLVEPHLPAGETTLISALERSYKSFLSMTWAVCVAGGIPVFGKYQVKQGRVLIIDLENTQEQLRARIRAAMTAHKADPSLLGDTLILFDRYTAEQRLTLDNGALLEMRTTVNELKPTLVVLDNMRKAWPAGVDENVTAQVNPILNDLVDICECAGAALVLVAHDRKDGLSHAGAGALASTPGNVVKLNKDRKTGVSTVKCESSRNGPEWDPFHVFMQDQALYLAQVGDRVAEPSREDKVIAALKHGKLSIRQLMDATSMAENTVRRATETLEKSGRIVPLVVKGSAVQYGLSAYEAGL